MKRFKKTLVVTATLLLVLLIAAALGIVYMMTPTRGRKIGAYSSPRKALLVIDIQEDFTGKAAKPPFPYKNSARLIAATNVAIDNAVEKGFLVVYIRQEFGGPFGLLWTRLFTGNTAVKGTLGAQMDGRVRVASSHGFSKPKGDAFANPALDAFLVEHQVDELYLAGLDAEYCVHLTAKGALNRGYKVSILEDAIALMAETKWDALMDEYRKDGITLMKTEEL